MSDAVHRRFPRGALLGAGALVTFAILAAVTARVGGIGVTRVALDGDPRLPAAAQGRWPARRGHASDLPHLGAQQAAIARLYARASVLEAFVVGESGSPGHCEQNGGE